LTSIQLTHLDIKIFQRVFWPSFLSEFQVIQTRVASKNDGMTEKVTQMAYKSLS